MWYIWIILAAVVYVVRRPNIIRMIYLSEKLPGPIALPIIGNGYLFLNKPLTEVFTTCLNWLPEYGNLLRIWLGDTLCVIIGHPIEAEAVLNNSKYIRKADMYDALHDWLGNGLLTSTGQKWYQRRKIITPAFHFQILEQFVGVFDKQSSTMVKMLNEYGPSDKVDIRSYAELLTLDVICETAMGTCIDAQQKSDQEYVKCVKEVAALIVARIFSLHLRYDIFYRFSSNRRQTMRCLKTLHDFTDNIIQARRREILDTQQKIPDDTRTDDRKRRYNFVDILLHAQIDGRPLTNLEIREEVDTFMFEGHDTMASAISFALYNIAKHPEVQRKCLKEIRTVIGEDRDCPMTMHLLNSLPYMDLVMKETLRMYPSVPTIGRKLSDDLVLDKHIIPVETNAMISIINMGRDPLLHESPEEFRPERFLNPKYNDKGKSFSNIPFSAGSRNCIGRKFAELELKSVLTKVLRHYSVTVHADNAENLVLVDELVLKTETPLWLCLSKRQQI